jgi:hypothetical protein
MVTRMPPYRHDGPSRVEQCPQHAATGAVGPAVLFALVFTVTTPGTAHAYLDPATGSLVVQVVAGTFVGGVYLVKKYWRQITGRLVRRAAGDDTPPSAPARPRPH